MSEVTTEQAVSEVEQDIADCQDAIEQLQKDLTIPGLSDHAIYAIQNQVSWNIGQISYLGSVLIDLEQED